MAEIRKRKGLTQEELAEYANINLRTVQRVENGETEPRGHTLSVICNVLEINIEDILDYGRVEDKNFFIYFNLSVISGMVIPFGDIIVPLILWLVKRDKIIGLNNYGKNLLFFRIGFNILLFTVTVISMVMSMNRLKEDFANNLSSIFTVYIVIYLLFTLIYPVIVAILIHKREKLKLYYPQFLK